MAKGLSNDYVEKVCKKILNNHTFLGVHPCDVHPSVDNRRNCSVIFNTGDSTTSGDHFVCMYLNKTTIFYFDSFGERVNLDKNILRFVNNIPSKKLVHNTQKIQDDLSQFCGFYCIAYLLSKDLKLSDEYFKSFFSKENLLLNDKNVIYFIEKHAK